MRKSPRVLCLALSLPLCCLAVRSVQAADDAPTTAELVTQIKSLQDQVSQLQAKENENWLTDERAEQIKGIVKDVLADARSQSQFADGPQMGYSNGFFIASPDQNYKLVINGFVQARYEYAMHHDANTTDSLHPVSSTRNEDNSSGFDVRRARLNFTGNVINPNIIYRFYADFYGNSTGNFTVLDAWAGYNFNDMFKIKAGSMEVPFAKDSLDSDTKLILMARPEVFTAMQGVDTPRATGIDVSGDLIKDKLNYEVQVNNGLNSNGLRRPDTTGSTANLDNRMGAYGRVQFAGSGSLKDFGDEPDLRTDNSAFIWLLGGGAGYESQSAASDTLPAPQSTAVGGVSNGQGPGFKNYTLNGDIFRGTIDWTAKYQGFNFQAAALFQQINANAGKGASLPFGSSGPSSFFEHGYYAQMGYMVIPQKLELVGRVQYLLTERYPNIGEYYTVGANYYLFGHNAKIQTDVTYSPESTFTDSGETQLQNTHNLSFRVQFQVMF